MVNKKLLEISFLLTCVQVPSKVLSYGANLTSTKPVGSNTFVIGCEVVPCHLKSGLRSQGIAVQREVVLPPYKFLVVCSLKKTVQQSKVLM